MRLGKLARNSQKFMKAYNLVMKTKLGNSLINKLDNDRKIYVGININTSKVLGSTRIGGTVWFDKGASDLAKIYKSIPQTDGNDMKADDLNKGQTVIRVLFQDDKVQDLSINEIAKSIYHELKAHIDMDYGDKNSAEEDHVNYGESTLAKGAREKSEAEKFHKQLEELENEN